MSAVTRVAAPPAQPLMIFDGDCAFCRRWIARWQQTTGSLVEYLPLQDPRVAERFPELSREQLEQAVHLVASTGEVTAGAEAVCRALAVRKPWALRFYHGVPGAATASEAAYRVVARHRDLFSVLTRWLWGDHVEQPAHVLVRWLFLRLLGVVYLIAFLSLGSQVLGLVGSHGILPARDLMAAVRHHVADSGAIGFLAEPTLCWLSTSDGFLQAQCWTGAGLSLLLIAGVAPLPCLALLWLLYLSLTTIGGVFLAYQWDNLLLETGFLALFFAPCRLWPHLAREAPPSRVVLWLLRWLLFRLMFASACVKLLSGDPAWRQLTALDFHYETQPLPTWVAWYAHQLPERFQQASVVVLFSIELALPFFIFLPRRPRCLAFWGFALLQLLIALTGNYGFFNLLTLALCVPLLDDAALRAAWPAAGALRPTPVRLSTGAAAEASGHGSGKLRRAAVWLVAAVVLALSAMEMAALFGLRSGWPEPLVWLYERAGPFRTVNGYGLFAVMTTARPEIIVEGSNDGRTWRAYEFKDQPGDLKRRPAFVAPHQPRLDWQMWFAALGTYRQNPWFLNFCARLLQGSPEVLGLLKHNPFPHAPPEYVRASLYDYHFTPRARRRADGAWWTREYRGLYCPPLSLKQTSEP